MPSTRSRAAFLAPILLSLVTACHSSADASSQPADAAAPRVVGDSLLLAANSPQLPSLSADPVTMDSARAITLNGRLVWNEDATARVFSPFAGRVTRIVANVGETVKSGTELAAIAAPDYGQAQADARRAMTDLSLAQRTLARQQDLLQHGVVAQKDVESAEADVQRARAEEDRARARLSLYGGDSSSVTQILSLKSPINGIVVERNVTPGQEVRPDQMLANAPQLFAPLFVVTDPSHLWVMLDVPERDTRFIRTGVPITLHSRALGDQTFHGTITLTAGGIDPASRTMKVRALVDNSSGTLRSEMLVTVDAPTSAAAGLVVPASAVVVVGDQQIVFIEKAKGHYVRREMHGGATHDGLIPVLSGLTAGDRVVTTTPLLLEQLFQNASHG